MRGVPGVEGGCSGVVQGVAIFVFSPQLPSREGATLESLLCVTDELKNY